MGCVAVLLAVSLLAGCDTGNRQKDPSKKGRQMTDQERFCFDQGKWAEWSDRLEEFKFDDDLVALYAIRVGLCTMVMQDRIDTERAIKIFQTRHDALMQKWTERWKVWSQHQQEAAPHNALFLPCRGSVLYEVLPASVAGRGVRMAAVVRVCGGRHTRFTSAAVRPSDGRRTTNF